MEKKKHTKKKGIDKLSPEDLEILDLYKQAYKRCYEDTRLQEGDLVRQTKVPKVD